MGNNGNIAYIADNRNAGWTQTFTYDGLNRLMSGSRSDGGYNHTYNYDSFGNLLIQDNISPGPSYNINNATNQLNRYVNGYNGYTYDAAGNLISSGTGDIGGHSFTYNALSQIMAVDGGTTASYIYNGEDQRAYKVTPSGWTAYIYFQGQPVAEQSHDATTGANTWTDYIYAGGQKIARVESVQPRVHLSGVNQSSTLGARASAATIIPSLNHVVQAGDSLYFRQYQNNAQGGLIVYFSDGSAAQWGVLDTDGQGLNNDTVRGQWHSRTVPLDGSDGNPSYVGKTLTTVLAVNDVAAPDGAFDMYFTDMAVVNGSTGAASAVFNAAPAQAVSSWSIFGGSSVTGVAAAIEAGTTDPSGSSAATTHYYLDDHLGTAQAELNAWGLPMWQGQFTPFGSELPDGSTTMHYKFTGKERDAESGLDYFGARFYASTTSRWMSPDWAAKPEAVPYSKLDDPQTLNLYAYVGNNPLRKFDPDGHINCSAYDGNTAACVNDNVHGMLKPPTEEQPQQLNSKTLGAMGLSTNLHVTATQAAAGVISQEFRGEGTEAAEAGAIIVINRTILDLGNDDTRGQWGYGGVSQKGLSKVDNAMLKIVSAPGQFIALAINPGHISSVLAGKSSSPEYSAALGKLQSVHIGDASLGNYRQLGTIDLGSRQNFVSNPRKVHRGGIFINHTEFY